jgi:hypothetical protein
MIAAWGRRSIHSTDQVTLAPPPSGLRAGHGLHAMLEHDPEKWTPVFGKDHAPPLEGPIAAVAGVGRCIIP